MDDQALIDDMVAAWMPTDEQLDEVIDRYPQRKGESDEAYNARVTREVQIFMIQNRLGVSRQTAVGYVKEAENRNGTQV